MPRICIDKENVSATSATTNPTAIPKPASASIRPGSAHNSKTGVRGQTDWSAMVIDRDNTIRAAVEECRSCGRGMKAKAPATRVSTSRNPVNASRESVSAPGMRLTREAGEIAEDAGRVGHQLHQHPGQQQHDSHQEGQ